jgi:branched-subunit amino acid ABC-type transport system permease component
VDYYTFVLFFLNGLTSAMTLFVIAAGLSLIFGVLRILNLAHGSLFMLGAYFAFQFTHWLGSFWFALILAPLVCAVVGIIIERFLIRPIYGIHMTFQLLLTFGIILLVTDLVRLFWGVSYRTVSESEILMGAANLFGVPYPRYNLFVILVGAFIGLLIWFLLSKTRIGKMVQAASSDREVASGLGINVPRVYTLVFAFGAWLAGLAGVLAAPLRSLMLELDVHTIVEAFVVVVIGGLGSIPGALIGSLLLGQLNAFGILYFSRYEMAFMYVLMAVVLVIKPHGLFGEKSA